MEQLNYEGEDEESIAKHYQEDKVLLKKLGDFQELWHGKSLVFNRLYKKGKSRSSEEEKEYNDAVAVLGKSPEELASTRENKYLYHHAMSAYHYALGKYEECYAHLKDNLEHLEANPDQFIEEPSIYLSVLSNIIFVGTQLGHFESSLELLEKVRKMPQSLGDKITEDMAIRIFSTASSLELSLYLNSGEFEKGMASIPSVEEELYRFENKLSAVRKAQFYFNIAAICFGAKNYNEALKWINQLLNNIGIDETQDIHCFAQMFNLIIHLELGNKSLVAYALRSTQRYLETRNKVYKFESVFLDFVNSSLHKRPTQTEEERYQTLLDELEKLKSDPYERTVFEYFDFLAWAESKVSGKAFSECLGA